MVSPIVAEVEGPSAKPAKSAKHTVVPIRNRLSRVLLVSRRRCLRCTRLLPRGRKHKHFAGSACRRVDCPNRKPARIRCRQRLNFGSLKAVAVPQVTQSADAAAVGRKYAEKRFSALPLPICHSLVQHRQNLKMAPAGDFHPPSRVILCEDESTCAVLHQRIGDTLPASHTCSIPAPASLPNRTGTA